MPASELLLLAPLLSALKQAGAAQLKLIAPAEGLGWLRPLSLPAQLIPGAPEALSAKLKRVTLGVDLEGQGRLAAALPEGTRVLTAPAPKAEQHLSKQLRAALAPLGPLPKAPPLALKPSRAAPSAGSPRVLLLPGPGLTEGGWLRLARGLLDAGHALALGGDAAEAPALRQLKRSLPKDTPLYAGKTAQRLARQIAEAPLIIGADPRPGLRLAQLLDRPCLGIYAQRSLLRFGPPYASRKAIAVSPPKQEGLHDPEGLLVQDILRRCTLLIARPH